MVKNVIKIMLRDFMIVKDKYLLMTTLSFVVLTLIDIFLAHDFTGYKLLLGALMFLMTIIQVEGEARFDIIELGLPVRRSTIVIARYLMVVVLTIISGVVVTIIHNILINYNLLPIYHAITLKIWVEFVVSSALLFGVFLTMYYKMANYKDSMPYSVMIILPIAVLGTFLERSMKVSWSITAQIALIVCLVIAYFASMLLAIKFHNQREF